MGDDILTADEQEVCIHCGGSGVIVIPATNTAGEIVDEQEQKCVCQKKEVEIEN